MEGTLVLRITVPVAGEGDPWASKAERPARAGRLALVGSATARKRPDALDSPARASTSS